MTTHTLHPNDQLDPARVVAAIERLARRIEERCADANLIRSCSELLRLAQDTREWSVRTGRPMVGLRIAVVITITLIGAFLVLLLSQVRGATEPWDVVRFPGLSHAAMINLILLAGICLLLVTVETRARRS